MDLKQLNDTAREIVAGKKGILAADESTGTIKKRFDAVGAESTEDRRRAYRELLFTATGAADYIGGVILFDETIRQSTRNGQPFPKLLASGGIVPGIKVDAGAKPLALAKGETVTEGLDGLRERLAEYRGLGARFAKWRAVITIGAYLPSEYCIRTNAHALARYAALCQEAGIVPIVEPEVLMDGGHTIERCEEVTENTLHAVFHELAIHHVALEGMLLKPNMVIAGKDCGKRADVRQVAEATVRCLRRTVPASVPGVVFLSGGQTEREATVHLNEMSKMGAHPWALSFSYGRALQASALDAWRGKDANVPAAQKAYLHRARCNGLARIGQYTEAIEREHATV